MRRFTRRRPFRRSFRPRFRRRGAPVARASFDKVVLYNNLDATWNDSNNCSPLIIPNCSSRGDTPQCGADTTTCGPNGDQQCTCCLNTTSFNIFSNDVLQSYWQDSVTIVRLYGDMWVQTQLVPPVGTLQCQTDARAWRELFSVAYAEHYSIAIRKHLRTQDATRTGLYPSSDLATPLVNYDWTESSPSWLYQRTKFWAPTAEYAGFIEPNDSFRAYPCGAGGSVLNPLELGTGNIDTHITCGCTNCTPGGQEVLCGEARNGMSVKLPPWHHFRFSIKRHIRMQRDQDLELQLAMRNPQNSSLFAWSCFPDSTLPTLTGGWQATQSKVFLRLACTLRLH